MIRKALKSKRQNLKQKYIRTMRALCRNSKMRQRQQMTATRHRTFTRLLWILFSVGRKHHLLISYDRFTLAVITRKSPIPMDTR